MFGMILKSPLILIVVVAECVVGAAGIVTLGQIQALDSAVDDLDGLGSRLIGETPIGNPYREKQGKPLP